ncbi:MAG TPA: hypothetical protein VGR50_06545, partial [Terriglobales bacterium]|nr:hypothetical protein [Terriglobales bacterium]
TNPYSYGVNLSCANPSSGSLNCNPPASATPTGAGTNVTVNASAAIAGDYTFQLQGNGGVNDPDFLQRDSTTATLHVIDLSMTAPAGITMGPNATSAASTFTATTAGTFPAASVNLSCAFPGGATGASCSFPGGTSFDPTAPSPHNLSVAVTTAGTPPGTYTVTINADPGGGLAPKTTTFQLVVQDFSYTVTPPTTVSVPINTNATFSGTISSLNNYAGTVVVSCQGGNPPATCTGQSVPLAAGQANAPFTVTAKSAVNFQFNFNVQGAGPLGATHAVPVTVNVGDFSLGAPTISTISAAPGNPSNATDFSLQTSQAGFSVNVALSCTFAPADATKSCAFFPSNNILATGTAQTVSMVVQTTSTTPVANGTTVTIKAVGNGITHTKTVTLNVVAGSGTADMSVALALAPPAKNPLLVGSKVQFTATAKNNSASGSASAVVLTFDVDNGASVVSASAPGYTCHTATLPITCDTGPALAFGSSVIFTVTVRVPFARAMNASARVSSSATDPNSANNATANPLLIRLRPWKPKGTPPTVP